MEHKKMLNRSYFDWGKTVVWLGAGNDDKMGIWTAIAYKMLGCIQGTGLLDKEQVCSEKIVICQKSSCQISSLKGYNTGLE